METMDPGTLTTLDVREKPPRKGCAMEKAFPALPGQCHSCFSPAQDVLQNGNEGLFLEPRDIPAKSISSLRVGSIPAWLQGLTDHPGLVNIPILIWV